MAGQAAGGRSGNEFSTTTVTQNKFFILQHAVVFHQGNGGDLKKSNVLSWITDSYVMYNLTIPANKICV